MQKILLSGKIGKVEYNAQKKIREDIIKRWDNLGLCKGLEGHTKETVATLFENQAKHLIYETSSADNSGSFETVVFPLIRRVFSKLLANDIVSVQAMNLPIGKLFFIKPVTSERQWDADILNADGTYRDGAVGRHVGLDGIARRQRNKNGELKNVYALPDEVVEPVNNGDGDITPRVPEYMKKTLYDLFREDFLFDNSKGKVTLKVGTASVVSIGMDGDYHSVASVDQIDKDAQSGSVKELLLQIGGFSSYNAGRLTGPDGNEMDSESFLASLKVIACKDIDGGDTFTSFKKGESIHFRCVTQKYGDQLVNYGDPCDAKGKMYIMLDLTKPVRKAGTGDMKGYIGVDPEALDLNQLDEDGNLNADTMFQIAWAQYDSLEFESEMGEVSFQLTSETVTVEERKLRATWTPELAQDVAAFHNIDAEAELTAILSEQIAAELDREILRDIRKAAAWQSRWDYNGWKRGNVTSTVYNQKDWNQTFITEINRLAAQIQKATLRGSANWIVVSSEINGSVLNDLEYFHVTDASAEADTYNMGIEKIGSIQGRYKVIVDPYAPHWSLIMGHHGKSLLDTGYIYAPYVPMALTPTMYNPFNFTPTKAISCRYAKKLVNNQYFGAIKVDGLAYFNPAELR